MDKAHLTADALCDFAEGLMPPADRREAEAHLAVCAECRREAAAMQGYFREMSGLETLKAPDRFLTRVHARIERESPWRRLLAALSSPRLLPVPLMGLAVVLVGVYFAFLSPRLAEEALSEAPSVAQAPERRTEPAEKSLPPPAVAMAPAAAEEPATRTGNAAAKPSAPPAEAHEAKKRIASLSKEARVEADDPSPRLVARKAAPARPKTGDNRAPASPQAVENPAQPAPAEPQVSIASAGPENAESEALAMAEPRAKAEVRREKPSRAEGGGASKGGKATNLKDTEVVGWQDNPSAVYILDNGGQSGDPVAEQIAGSRGTADRLEDAPAPASAAPPAVTPKPWAPLVYTLKARLDEATLRSGLAKLGIRILRHEEGSDRRYELEVPATQASDLEKWLAARGALTTTAPPSPGKQAGAPFHLTLKVVAP